MLKMEINSLKNEDNTAYPVLEVHESIYKERLKSIFDFLETTDDQTQYFKMLHPLDVNKILNESSKVYNQIKDKFKYFVFIGMGGAISNPKMLHQFSLDFEKTDRCFFLNTLDPIEFEAVIRKIDLKNTCVIAISNTGNTAETVSLYLAFEDRYNEMGLQYRDNFVFVTAYNESYLIDIAKANGFVTLEYDAKVGGRFSSFSNSSVLSGMIFGLDMRKYLETFNEKIKQFWAEKEENESVKSALALFTAKKKIWPVISYVSRLAAYALWYCQIVSESLGKEKIGYAAFFGICPMEQHAMYEYCINGSDDVLVTFINCQANYSKELKTSYFHDSAFSCKPLKEINDRFFQGSIEFFKESKIAYRSIVIKEFNEEAAAELITHSLIEVAIIAFLNRLHPFDNPSLLACKKFTMDRFFKK